MRFRPCIDIHNGKVKQIVGGLSTLKLKYEEALAEYEKCRCTGLGRLVANREVPVLKRAKELLSQR